MKKKILIFLSTLSLCALSCINIKATYYYNEDRSPYGYNQTIQVTGGTTGSTGRPYFGTAKKANPRASKRKQPVQVQKPAAS